MRKHLGELMEEKGFTQGALSRATGITQAAISQILHGKQAPNIRTARKIAAALGVSVDDIIFPGEVRSEQQLGRDDPSQVEAKAA